MNHICTSLTINNVLQSDVGRLLDVIREAGFDVEINVSGIICEEQQVVDADHVPLFDRVQIAYEAE